jgi:hypothetical protein
VIGQAPVTATIVRDTLFGQFYEFNNLGRRWDGEVENRKITEKQMDRSICDQNVSKGKRAGIPGYRDIGIS